MRRGCVALQVPLDRWYTATYQGTRAFVKVVPAGAEADREVATLRTLQSLRQCRVVRLLHAARVTLMEPQTRQVTAPHVAIVTKLAPHPLFASARMGDRLRQAIELVEVRVWRRWRGAAACRLKRCALTSLCCVVMCCATVCQAVGAMHSADIIHGDLKPSNVRVDDEDHVCVLDVESAIVDWQRLSATARSRVLHTEGYAAPEVEDGVDCTPASDVYSLGVMLRDNVSTVWVGSLEERGGGVYVV